MVRFISYNGTFPNLCSGTLVLEINGEVVTFPPYCMCSGGRVWFDGEWSEHVESGEWDVEIPKQYEGYRSEILQIVNENVLYGCCGGCV
jgi:hypothetical protein